MAASADTAPSRHAGPGKQMLALQVLREHDDEDESGSPGPTLASILSSELLRGRKAVAIRHNGSTYRLQATRLGKLILTK